MTVLKSYGPSLTVNVTVYIQTASRERDRIVKSWPRHHCSEVPVQKIQEYGNSPAQRGRVCWHCGKKGHQSEHCRFKNAVCYRCHKKGHIEANCKARQEKEELKWVDKQGEDDIKGHGYHVIDTLCEGTMGSLFKSQGTSETSAYMVKMEVNGESLMMEIDTGGAVTIISEEVYIGKSFQNYC